MAEQVLRGLGFKEGQLVISLIAATSADQIAAWSGVAQICRAVPLPFVEQRCDVTPVFPPHSDAAQLINALGAALPVQDQASFDPYATLSSLMGSHFGLLETSAAWATDKDLPASDARVYLAGLFHNLGKVAHRTTDAPLTACDVIIPPRAGRTNRSLSISRSRAARRR